MQCKLINADMEKKEEYINAKIKKSNNNNNKKRQLTSVEKFRIIKLETLSRNVSRHPAYMY